MRRPSGSDAVDTTPAGMFDPSTYLDLGVTLLGGIKLSDVIPAVPFPDPRNGDDKDTLPKVVTTRTGTAIDTVITWKPTLQEFAASEADQPTEATAGEPEADEPPFGTGQGDPEPDASGSGSSLPRHVLLDFERAGERQRRVQARLRTVSFTLEVVAIVAAGSKQEWMPQCSQRWSFPGP